jgi:hypothetical protein
MRRTAAVLLPPAVFAVFAVTAPAAAAHGNHTPAVGDSSAGEPGSYSIELGELNGSGASGVAALTLAKDGSLTVSIEAQGLVPGQPHAQHIHGDSSLERDFTCPTQDADADGDGIVNTLEGLLSYGEIHIALTTHGDATPTSGLAVDWFPVAGADGSVSYQRVFKATELPDGTATAVRNLHVVTHGIDLNGNGEYDLAAGPSELDPALPQEATAPASCGIIEGSNISTIPAGGVDTGVGPLTGTGNGAVAGPPVLTFSAMVGFGALWVIGGSLRRQRTAVR